MILVDILKHLHFLTDSIFFYLSLSLSPSVCLSLYLYFIYNKIGTVTLDSSVHFQIENFLFLPISHSFSHHFSVSLICLNFSLQYFWQFSFNIPSLFYQSLSLSLPLLLSLSSVFIYLNTQCFLYLFLNDLSSCIWCKTSFRKLFNDKCFI